MAPSVPAAAWFLALVAIAACDQQPRSGADRDGAMDITRAAVLIEPSVRAPCDSVAARWRSIATAVVTHDDTVMAADAVLPDDVGDSLVASSATSAIRACRVVAFLAKGEDTASSAQQYWPAKGWGRMWRLTADGPDGQVETFQRGTVRCQVRGEWDGGDDSDSTYVPLPFYRQVTLCWRHGRALVPSDTTLPTP